MPGGDGWRRFTERLERVLRVVDRIILVGVIVVGVLVILGVGVCLVQYARM